MVRSDCSASPADATAPLSASILICTYNRAALLADTLASLCRIHSARRWEIVVADNNSSDDTRAVVERLAASAPVPVHYLFEATQGKSHALNTGLKRCTGEVVVFTDDDVCVPAGWLEAACEALERD